MRTSHLVAAAIAVASTAIAQSSAGTVSFFGDGCPAGSAPSIGNQGLPIAGGSVVMEVRAGPANSAAFLFLGFSNSVFAGQTLPIDLGFIGATGCSVLVSGDLTLGTVTDAAGDAAIPVVLPASVAVGPRYYHQWFIVDTTLPGGLAVSAGAELEIGNAFYGVNLIANPGAEEDPGQSAGQQIEVSRWIDRSPYITAQLYNGFSVDDPGTGGVYPGAAFGNNYFYGGDAWGSQVTDSMFQTVDVHDGATDIDAGRVDYTLDGWFGGWSTQDDTATLIATFVDGAGNALGNAVQVGGVNSNSAARGGNSSLLQDTALGTLPVNTRRIELELRFDKIPAGSYQDGAADNLSLILTRR